MPLIPGAFIIFNKNNSCIPKQRRFGYGIGGKVL